MKSSSEPIGGPEWTIDARKLQLIQQVRARVLDQVHSNPELYDEQDVAMIRENDWQIQRYIIRCHGNLERTVTLINRALLWKKEIGMAQMGPHLFPPDFYQIGAMFESLPDKQNNAVLFIRAKYHRKVNELSDGILYFVLYSLLKLDQRTRGKGMLVVIDWEGFGYVNLDMKFAWHLTQAIVQHSAYARVKVIQLNFPRWLVWFWNVILGWIPSEYSKMVTFIKREEIINYIDQKHIPFYLGGDSPLNYHSIPEGTATDEQLVESGNVDWDSLPRVRAIYRKMIDEAKQETELIKQKHGDKVIDFYRYGITPLPE